MAKKSSVRRAPICARSLCYCRWKPSHHWDHQSHLSPAVVKYSEGGFFWFHLPPVIVELPAAVSPYRQPWAASACAYKVIPIFAQETQTFFFKVVYISCYSLLFTPIQLHKALEWAPWGSTGRSLIPYRFGGWNMTCIWGIEDSGAYIVNILHYDSQDRCREF